MRKVFLDDLPRRGKLIDWKSSVGRKVDFIYDDIQGKVKIVDYLRNSGRTTLNIEYNDHSVLIGTGSFSSCQLGGLLKTHTSSYRYGVGQTVSTVTGKIQILKQVRMNKGRYKGYIYKCLLDGNVDQVREGHILNGVGCNVCGKTKTLKGYNDLWTTNPDIAKMLKNSEDGYKVTKYNNNKRNFICAGCGYEKNIQISVVTVNGGFQCPKCSDGISYPEKFVLSLLEQLDLEFKTQLSKSTFSWCENYRYDFYIPKYNCILETHGAQHYEDKFTIKTDKTLGEVKKNDKAKVKLASINNIQHYIIIDSRHSELQWIKNNIMESNLPKILGFSESDIDWIACHEFACNSLVKEISNMYSVGKDIPCISKETKLSFTTVYNYLRQGTIIGWCDYKTQAERRYENIRMAHNYWNNSIKSEKEIAKHMGVHIGTVRDYLKKIP